MTIRDKDADLRNAEKTEAKINFIKFLLAFKEAAEKLTEERGEQVEPPPENSTYRPS